MNQKSMLVVLVVLVVVLAGTTIYFAVSKNAYAPSASQTVPAESLAGKIPANVNQPEAPNPDQNKKPYYAFEQKRDSVCNEGIMPDNGNGKAEMIIKKDGQRVGSFILKGICQTGGYKIFARNSKYLYFSVRPDGLGGFFSHDSVYPNLFRLKIADNSVEQILNLKQVTSVEVSGDGKLAVYWESGQPSIQDNSKEWKIVVKNIESGSIKNYKLPTSNSSLNDSYGDYIFSPNDDKIAIGVIDQQKAALDEKYLKNTFYILDLASGAYTKYDIKDKNTYPWVEENYKQQPPGTDYE